MSVVPVLLYKIPSDDEYLVLSSCTAIEVKLVHLPKASSPIEVILFGIKTEAVQDVFESMSRTISELVRDNKTVVQRLRAAEDKIADAPKQTRQAVTEAENKLVDSYRKIIEVKNSQIADRDRQIKELEKYKSSMYVKSIDEIGAVMPETILETIKAMGEHKIAARKSMFDYLMTGKGQEEALAQIERSNILTKAHMDGMFEIPDLKEAVKKAYYGEPLFFVENLIKNSLLGTEKSEYLNSKSIRNQVKTNAIAIASPFANERYSNTNLANLPSRIDKILDEVLEVRTSLANGMKQLKAARGEAVEFKPVEFDMEASKYLLKDGNTPYEANYWNLVNIGRY